MDPMKVLEDLAKNDEIAAAAVTFFRSTNDASTAVCIALECYAGSRRELQGMLSEHLKNCCPPLVVFKEKE